MTNIENRLANQRLPFRPMAFVRGSHDLWRHGREKSRGPLFPGGKLLLEFRRIDGQIAILPQRPIDEPIERSIDPTHANLGWCLGRCFTTEATEDAEEH